MTEHDIACKIHDAAIDLLNDPGIKLDHEEICDLNYSCPVFYFVKPGNSGRSAEVKL